MRHQLEQRCSVLMLLLLLSAMTFVVNAEHDNGFCTITPNNPNVKLPNPPKLFYMTATSRTGGTQLTAREYFNSETMKSTFYIFTTNSTFRIHADENTKQVLVNYVGSRDIPGNCRVETLQSMNELLIGFEIMPGIRSNIPSKALFFGSGGEGISDIGPNAIDGIQVQQFYSCYYLKSFDASIKINWYFADIQTNPFPMRITLEKQFNSENKKQETETIVITNFQTLDRNWAVTNNPWIVQSGVYCPGMVSNRELPTLPQRFSIRMEEVLDGIQEPVYIREAYDFLANLSLLQRMPPPSEKPSKYGPGKLLFLHDFRKGHSFVINEAMGNCTYEKLTGSEWDASKEGASLVRMRNPREYFDMDGAMTQYKGSGPIRGLPSDVFIGLKQLKNEDTAGLEFNTTIEWYFVNKTIFDAIGNTMVNVAVPAAIRTKSLAPWLNSWLYVFDYESDGMHFNRHDISSCFSRDQRQHFIVYFPLKNSNMARYVRDHTKQFLSFVLPVISGSVDFSHLRIYDPEVTADAENAMLEFSVTDAPPNSGDLPLNEIQPKLQDLVAKNNIIAVFTDDRNNLISATASSVTTIEERSKNLKSIGYSAGEVALAAIGLLIAGIVAGIIAAFFYFR